MNFLLKPKFLLWIVIILILVNVATFIGIVLTRHEHRSMEKDREEYFNKLGLRPEQRQFFIDKRDLYKKKNFPLYSKYDNLMLELRKKIANSPTDTASLFAITDSLGKINGKIRKNWTKYSLDIRGTLDQQQKQKFDSLAIEHVKEKMKR